MIPGAFGSFRPTPDEGRTNARRNDSEGSTVGYATRSMGGRLVIHVDTGPGSDGDSDAARAGAAARRVAARVERWAARLTRHDEGSELCRLNADPRATVPIGPTLAAALRAARDAVAIGSGFVDITLLDARLSAETGAALESATAGSSASTAGSSASTWAGSVDRSWRLEAGSRSSTLVTRVPGVRFDLGGVGKGWIADRAARLLDDFPAAVVDADGDLAINVAPGRTWSIGVDDPRLADGQLTVLRLGSSGAGPRTWGVATSGTSVHRWTVDGTVRHHLIDPRTGMPARTDVVQATVIAGSALHAEAYAKAAVIAGSGAGFALLDRAPIRGAVLLLEDGRVLALPNTLSLLAA